MFCRGRKESTAGKSVKQIGQRGPESPCSVSDVYMDEQNRGDRGSERGRDGEGGDILQQLLSKVCLLELSHSEIRDRDRENTLLRGALQVRILSVPLIVLRLHLRLQSSLISLLFPPDGCCSILRNAHCFFLVTSSYSRLRFFDHVLYLVNHRPTLVYIISP